MYAPLLFASLLSTLGLLRALQRGAVVWWGVYTCITTYGIFLHIFMGLTVVTHCGWMLLFHRRYLLWCLGSGMLAAMLAFPFTLQWLELVVRRVVPASMTTGLVTGGQRVTSLGWEGMPYTFYVYGVGFSLGPTPAELHANRSVEYLLRFLPSILTVGLIWGTLLVFWALLSCPNTASCPHCGCVCWDWPSLLAA